MDSIENCAQSFFSRKGFLWEKNQNVVSSNDKLLYNISGGVCFEEAIEGKKVLNTPYLASIQTCLRTDSLNKIGISGRHHIAFDMLGHFCIYGLSERKTKELLIQSAYDFLISEIKLAPERIRATVHPSDLVSLAIWKSLDVTNITMLRDNITVTPSNNRSGFRTEILWNQSGEVYIELWNIVFTQFNNNQLLGNSMPLIAGDSGASLDRLLTASEDLSNDYHNSYWRQPIECLKSNIAICESNCLFKLLDCIKAIITLNSNGITPSNKAAGYILRKIIREAYTAAKSLRIDLPTCMDICENAWIKKSISSLSMLKVEIERFDCCLSRGERECQKILKRNNGTLTQKDILFLQNTFGYPSELALAQQSLRR